MGGGRLGVSSGVCSSRALILTLFTVIARRKERERDRAIKERQGVTTV